MAHANGKSSCKVPFISALSPFEENLIDMNAVSWSGPCKQGYISGDGVLKVQERQRRPLAEMRGNSTEWSKARRLIEMYVEDVLVLRSRSDGSVDKLLMKPRQRLKHALFSGGVLHLDGDLYHNEQLDFSGSVSIGKTYHLDKWYRGILRARTRDGIEYFGTSLVDYKRLHQQTYPLDFIAGISGKFNFANVNLRTGAGTLNGVAYDRQGTQVKGYFFNGARQATEANYQAAIAATLARHQAARKMQEARAAAEARAQAAASENQPSRLGRIRSCQAGIFLLHQQPLLLFHRLLPASRRRTPTRQTLVSGGRAKRLPRCQRVCKPIRMPRSRTGVVLPAS